MAKISALLHEDDLPALPASKRQVITHTGGKGQLRSVAGDHSVSYEIDIFRDALGGQVAQRIFVLSDTMDELVPFTEGPVFLTLENGEVILGQVLNLAGEFLARKPHEFA